MNLWNSLLEDVVSTAVATKPGVGGGAEGPLPLPPEFNYEGRRPPPPPYIVIVKNSGYIAQSIQHAVYHLTFATHSRFVTIQR